MPCHTKLCDIITFSCEQPMSLGGSNFCKLPPLNNWKYKKIVLNLDLNKSQEDYTFIIATRDLRKHPKVDGWC